MKQLRGSSTLRLFRMSYHKRISLSNHQTAYPGHSRGTGECHRSTSAWHLLCSPKGSVMWISTSIKRLSDFDAVQAGYQRLSFVSISYIQVEPLSVPRCPQWRRHFIMSGYADEERNRLGCPTRHFYRPIPVQIRIPRMDISKISFVVFICSPPDTIALTGDSVGFGRPMKVYSVTIAISLTPFL